MSFLLILSPTSPSLASPLKPCRGYYWYLSFAKSNDLSPSHTCCLCRTWQGCPLSCYWHNLFTQLMRRHPGSSLSSILIALYFLCRLLPFMLEPWLSSWYSFCLQSLSMQPLLVPWPSIYHLNTGDNEIFSSRTDFSPGLCCFIFSYLLNIPFWLSNTHHKLNVN